MRKNTTKTLTTCALLAALSVILARLIIPMPNEFTRFSIEAVPIFIAGMLYGPIAGGLVGFAADFVGCLFSGYGYNPIFCVPPIFYGVCAGLFRNLGFFRPFLQKKYDIWRIALAFLPSIVLGSILYQSASLAWVYGGGNFMPKFLAFLGTRSVQFGITFVLDVVIVYLLCKSNIFTTAKLWQPMKKEKK